MTSSSRESRNTNRKERCFQFNCDRESYHSPQNLESDKQPLLASQKLSHCSRNPTFTRIERQPSSAGGDAHQPQSRARAIPSAPCTPEQGALPRGMHQTELRLLSGFFTLLVASHQQQREKVLTVGSMVSAKYCQHPVKMEDRYPGDAGTLYSDTLLTEGHQTESTVMLG